MKLTARIFVCWLLIFFGQFSCKKFYDPPIIKNSNHFLAVDGFIYTGSGVSSTITLSRSLNLYDSVPNRPEFNALVLIESSTGDSYQLFDTAGTGTYSSLLLTLDSSLRYRVDITTTDGNKYQSDFVTPKQAPPVDSVTWELVGDPDTANKNQAVNLYVNAHDPNNATHYYRWDFTETYKHFSVYETNWMDSNGRVYPFPVGYSIHTCWSTYPSKNIMVGTTISLSLDIVSHYKIFTIVQNDPTLDVGCSLLIRQYPLTEEGFNYWLNVQKNSQSLGGLYDLQPSQINGNFHCITNPVNPILGFISASSVQSYRVYISNKNVPGWNSNQVNSSDACQIEYQPVDPLNTLLYNFPDTAYAPYFFYGPELLVAPKSCLDCRYQGGTNIKPAFWPHYD
jgi:hypothetical protein